MENVVYEYLSLSLHRRVRAGYEVYQFGDAPGVGERGGTGGKGGVSPCCFCSSNCRTRADRALKSITPDERMTLRGVR